MFWNICMVGGGVRVSGRDLLRTTSSIKGRVPLGRAEKTGQRGKKFSHPGPGWRCLLQLLRVILERSSQNLRCQLTSLRE